MNLRYYVRRKAAEGRRRGVGFVKELVPRRALELASDRGRVAYEWRRNGAWEGLFVDYSGEPSIPPEDSEESFITERHWSYTCQRVRRGRRL